MSAIRAEGSWSSRRQLGLWVAEPPRSLHYSSATNLASAEQEAHSRLSTLLIGLIGIVCVASLAVVYFKFFYKYWNACDVGVLQRSGSSLRRAMGASADSAIGGGGRGHGSSDGGGLALSLIKLLPSVEFDDELVVEAEKECAICLTPFLSKETLRLLPSCAHLFHQPCVDTWLLSHASCPLCRRGIFLLDKTFCFAHVMAPPLPYTRGFSISPQS